MSFQFTSHLYLQVVAEWGSTAAQKTPVQRGGPSECRNITTELPNNADKKSPKEKLEGNLNPNISARWARYSKPALKMLVVLMNTPIAKPYQELPPRSWRCQCNDGFCNVLLVFFVNVRKTHTVLLSTV